ncbi:hypothetical protein TI05_15175, partial [Achromatium sp. WMS3]
PNPNGLFTREFLKSMQEPGLNVREVINKTRTTVYAKAKAVGHEQMPAIYDESVGSFVFTPGMRREEREIQALKARAEAAERKAKLAAQQAVTQQQTETARLAKEELQKQKRVALVIGNTNYTHLPPLPYVTNEADDIANALRRLNFSVEVHKDVDGKGAMYELIENFKDTLRAKDVGLFFYSGHSVEVGGEHYIIPTNAHIKNKNDFLGISRYIRIAKDAENEINIIILTACRTNPGIKKTAVKNSDIIQDMSNFFVAFATSLGYVSHDPIGDGERNSPYVKHILANIEIPGIDINEMFRRVRIGVSRDTKNRQIPQNHDSLLKKFCFAGCVD